MIRARPSSGEGVLEQNKGKLIKLGKLSRLGKLSKLSRLGKLSKLSKPRRLHYLKSAPGAAKFPPKK